MFGLGFKKNQEKEMLSRTIDELRELRAELSVLKERLTMIIQDQAGESPSGLAVAETAVSGCDTAGTGTPSTDWNETEITGENGDVHIIMEESGAQADTGKDVDPDGDPPAEHHGECDGEGAGGERGDTGGTPWVEPCAGDLHDCSRQTVEGEDLPGGDVCVVKKEWAVVSFKGQKKPWWKWWGPKNHLVRRSV